MRRLRQLVLVVAILLLFVLAVYLGSQSRRGASAGPETAASAPAPALVPVTRGDVTQTILAPGQLVGTREVILSPKVGGRLANLLMAKGEQVKTGQVLAHFDTLDLEAQIAQAQATLRINQARLEQLKAGVEPADLIAAQAAVETARQNLATVQAGSTAQQIAAAEATLKAAQDRYKRLLAGPSADAVTVAKAGLERARLALEKAQAEYDRIAWRNDVGMTPQAAMLQQATLDYQIALADYNLANRSPTVADIQSSLAQVNQAQDALDRLKSSPTPAEIAQAESQLAQAQAQLQRLQRGPDPQEVTIAETQVQQAEASLQEAHTKLQNADLVAPFDGVIADVMVRPGESVMPGQSMALLVDPSAIEVRATVIEEDLPGVKVGQVAQLYYDAQPDVVSTGQVTRIVPYRVPLEDRPLYYVYVSISQPVAGLVSGMTADATIVVAERKNVIRLPRGILRGAARDTARVKIWAGGSVQERAVKIGLRGNTYVEILDGLQEGEQVQDG